MQVAVDIGGTFTDLLVRDGAGGIRATKIPTTPEDQARGIMDGLRHHHRPHYPPRAARLSWLRGASTLWLWLSSYGSASASTQNAR